MTYNSLYNNHLLYQSILECFNYEIHFNFYGTIASFTTFKMHNSKQTAKAQQPLVQIDLT